MTPEQNGNFRNHIPSDDFSTIEKVKGVWKSGFFVWKKNRHLPFYPKDYQRIIETFWRNNMTPLIKFQEFRSLLYKM